jgi:N-acetylglutamate synthase-like GNAT family acetyltransferase
MVFPSVQGDRSFAIRPAVPADAAAVHRLLYSNRRSHRHLYWRPATDWLGRAPACVAEDRHGLAGCLITPADPPPAAWVRAAAVRDGAPLAPIMDRLFAACLELLAAQGIETLAAMPSELWLPPILDALGFAIVEQVETWEKNDLHAVHQGAPDVQVRPVHPADMAQLTCIERAAFAPRWRHSVETLALAWESAATFTVAQREGGIVGYQVSLASGDWAHLARITVHPAVQRSGVGTRLLADALARYVALGLARVSLNTQSDNLPSHRLYHAFGFRRVAPPLPVWERPV